MSESRSIRLNMLGLPSIQTVENFSRLTHVSVYGIYQLSKNSDKHYKTYSIPKKDGKLRTISQPSRNLKGLQSWVLVNILDKLKVSSSCKGFEKGSSTAENAKPHCGANVVLNIDLSDFFFTVRRNYVYRIFRSVGYNELISTVLTNICTCNGSLPQGGPCSPKLANLASWTLDIRLQGYVGKRGINYTRYADDLTFSGLNPAKFVKILPRVKAIIEDEKFKVNPKKTRIAGSARAKKVTGLVISNDTYGIGKQQYKILRSKVYHLTLPEEQDNFKLLKEVKGWVSYLNSVDKLRHIKLDGYIDSLSSKYPETLISKIKR